MVIMDLLQRMRIVGSGLIIAAYFITLHLDVVTGVIVHMTAMSISVPYFIRSKAWDVVITMSFLVAIGTGRLITSAIGLVAISVKRKDCFVCSSEPKRACSFCDMQYLIAVYRKPACVWTCGRVVQVQG